MICNLRPLGISIETGETVVPTALRRAPPPETLELDYRLRELTDLRATLATREAALDHLRRVLHSFEARYIRQVGVLYVQLDDWNDQLAELLASRNPKPSAEHSSYWSADRLAEPEPSASETADSLQQTTDLRTLFRAVARRIHPDHATGTADELRRTALMAQANDALQRHDADLLHRMLHSHDDAGNPTRLDPKAEIARVLSLISQTHADLASLAAEHAALAASEMAQLYETTTAAAISGRDHLAEMAARVKGAIGAVMGRFERESSPSRRPAPIDPTSLLTAETRPLRFPSKLTRSSL